MRRSPSLALRRYRLETPDGDFVDVLRLPANPDAPRLLVLHGLEGSARSHYVGAMFSEMHRRGWGMDVLLFRSCGDEPNRTARFYHSGETGDVSFVLTQLMQEFPSAVFAVAGFSLGGNVLLKWLGEVADRVPDRLRAAVAVSVPFDLSRSVDRIGSGFSRVYEHLFLRSLKRKALEKAGRFPEHSVFTKLGNVTSLRGFDDAVTAPLHGFDDAADYYARSSAIGWLHSITVPTLLLNAADDPFLPADVLTAVAEQARANPALTTEFTARGGHVGFVAGSWPWAPTYYAESRVANFCEPHLEARTLPKSKTSPPTELQRGIR
jgi:hypothetical protein